MTAPLPYYEDDAVTLYNARCEDVLPTLNLSGPVGRKAVGIEMDRHWCDHAVRRLAQMTLPMMT